METGYQLAKDIGEIKSKLEALSNSDCNCKKNGTQSASRELTPENRRVLGLLQENAEALTKTMENAFVELGIRPVNGEQFFMTKFTFSPVPRDTANGPMSPWGPYIAACCPDGTYSACYEDGCDPCEGHYS